jgi:hypothetical protein
MSYDGSIRIDTSIDDKSFNVGMAKLSSAIKTAMTGVVGALGKVVIVGAVVTAIVVAIAAAFVLLVLAVVAFGFKIITEMAKAVNRTSAFGQQIEQINKLFADVKGAIYGAFSPLIIAAIPYIIMAVNWLVKLLNTVQMIIAALLGQKTVMQYVAGSAASAATATGKLADNTSKAGKAAKGALAAFDQLNVLQQDTADTSGAGSSGGGAMQFTEVPITASVLDTVNKIKQWFADAWTWIQTAWSNVSVWFKQWVWGPLMIGFAAVWTWIVSIWNVVAPWFQTNVIDPLAEKLNWLVGVMVENGQKMYSGFIQPLVSWFMTYLWPIIAGAMSLIITNIRSSFDFVISVFGNAFVMIAGIVGAIITQLGGIIQFITGVFTGNWKLAWEGIKTIFKSIFESIGAIVKGVVNTVIDFINMMIRAVAAGLNAVIGALNTIRVTIPQWVPVIGGQNWGINLPNVPVPQIPRLATGAVIPPNSQFAAILGDQRSGVNIEAPADLIRQIVREELGGSQGGDMNITMPVYLDSEKIYEGQKRVSRRRGTSLIVGSTV